MNETIYSEDEVIEMFQLIRNFVKGQTDEAFDLLEMFSGYELEGDVWDTIKVLMIHTK